MSARQYDAVVVGARCAGAPTAMLLARKGYRVLVVDRAQFPSDTVSTHLVHPPGVAAIERWGLLERLVATGCPPVTSYTFDFGPVVISGTPQAAGRPALAYCPRRTVLDALLVEAAAEAGAEVRADFTVSEILVEDGAVVGVSGHARGGATVTERARVVIGADGAHSRVAEAVAAPAYREGGALSVGYYAYWSGMPVDGARWSINPDHAVGVAPTHDGLTMLLTAWPHAHFAEVKKDLESRYLAGLRQAYGERLDSARRETRVVGAGVPNRVRVPYGPGWALVGDAGYLKDPATAQGISDAFRDAELCAAALDEAFTGSQAYDDAMAGYHRRRDEAAMPMYEFTQQISSFEPPPPELQQLLAATAGDPDAMNDFASLFAGTLSPIAFFDSARVSRLRGGREAAGSSLPSA